MSHSYHKAQGKNHFFRLELYDQGLLHNSHRRYLKCSEIDIFSIYTCHISLGSNFLYGKTQLTMYLVHLGGIFCKKYALCIYMIEKHLEMPKIDIF